MIAVPIILFSKAHIPNYTAALLNIQSVRSAGRQLDRPVLEQEPDTGDDPDNGGLAVILVRRTLAAERRGEQRWASGKIPGPDRLRLRSCPPTGFPGVSDATHKKGFEMRSVIQFQDEPMAVSVSF